MISMKVHYDAEKNLKLDDIMRQINLAKNFIFFYSFKFNITLLSVLGSPGSSHLFRNFDQNNPQT